MADPRIILSKITSWPILAKFALCLAALLLSTKAYFLLRPFVIADTPTRFSDYYVFWSVAQIIEDYGSIAAFDRDLLNTYLSQFAEPFIKDAGEEGSFGLFWLYPPTVLPWIWPLGHMSAEMGLLVYVVAALAMWSYVVKRHFEPHAGVSIWPVLFAPIVFVTLAFEQNGLFTAAILISFIYAVKNKQAPWLIGVIAALMLYKPHFGVLMPVILILEKDWRSFLWAGVFCSLYLAVVTAIWGMEYWQAFFDKQDILHQFVSRGDFARYTISSLGFMQQLGISYEVAIWVHLLVALLLIGIVVFIWRQGNWDFKIASFLMITPLIPPYAAVYDFTVSAFALGLVFPYFRATRLGAIFITAYWMAPMNFRTEARQFDILELPILNAIMVGMIVYFVRSGASKGDFYQASSSASQ